MQKILKINLKKIILTLTVLMLIISGATNYANAAGAVTANMDAVSHSYGEGIIIDPLLNDIFVNDGAVISSIISVEDNINYGIIDNDTKIEIYPAGAMPGVHTIRYKICDAIDTLDCSEADIIITTLKDAIVANPDNYSARIEQPSGILGSINVMNNDTILEFPATFRTATTNIISSGGMNSVQITSDGFIYWNAYERPGTYLVQYNLCQIISQPQILSLLKNDNLLERFLLILSNFFLTKAFAYDDLTSNCATGLVTINVVADKIQAKDDFGTTIVGTALGVDLIKNDSLEKNNFSITPITTIEMTSNSGLKSAKIDEDFGGLTIDGTEQEGLYQVKYKICQYIKILDPKILESQQAQAAEAQIKFLESQLALEKQKFLNLNSEIFTIDSANNTNPDLFGLGKSAGTVFEFGPLQKDNVPVGADSPLDNLKREFDSSYIPNCSEGVAYINIKSSAATELPTGPSVVGGIAFIPGQSVNNNPIKNVLGLNPESNQNTNIKNCEPLLTKDIILGGNNDSIQVNNIIRYLNEYHLEKLAVDGTYDKDDFDAVKRFQAKYIKTVINVWGGEAPTGIVSIYTRGQINVLRCAQTTSCPYFTEYVKLGTVSLEVSRIKNYLNLLMGESLVVNNTFDKNLFEAVKKYQAVYGTEVLSPWGLKESTGYWYKTTRYAANIIVNCKEKSFPVLEGR